MMMCRPQAKISQSNKEPSDVAEEVTQYVEAINEYEKNNTHCGKRPLSSRNESKKFVRYGKFCVMDFSGIKGNYRINVSRAMQHWICAFMADVCGQNIDLAAPSLFPSAAGFQLDWYLGGYVTKVIEFPDSDEGDNAETLAG
ncbi:unnamed protein product [Nippostrongylus brasiliensis]|uniref:FERM domain-containing protein n=1 Tax=Nippostrongylus brasiliensis TaxID=27835 RepID=A0A0N4YRA9_NIPBR|nr:unnamed protein product [Nippostrongylus brasiliensis]